MGTAPRRSRPPGGPSGDGAPAAGPSHDRKTAARKATAEDATAEGSAAGDSAARKATARDAAARDAWADAYHVLSALPPGTLTPDDLCLLADAAWWTGHPDESVAARAQAYSGYARTGAERPAGHAAWMLFYDNRDIGRPGAASGWLHRARQHLDALPECLEQCYTAWSDAEEASERGDVPAALAAARRMSAIARAHGDRDPPAGRDLLAMSHQVHAGVLLDHGRTAEGLARLDDAMCSVTAGELSSLFTGWIYCLALTRCMAAADLGRAVEWSEAAMRWCADRSADDPFRGLCRVHRVQVLDLRGDWPGAAAEALRVCAETGPHDAGISGEAHYIAGDIHRRRGDSAAAETEYARAHALGRTPQPGLALLRLAEGRADQAAAALRLALTDEFDGTGPAGPFGTAQLLAALVEVELAVGNARAARVAVGELERLAGTGPSSVGAAGARGTGTAPSTADPGSVDARTGGSEDADLAGSDHVGTARSENASAASAGGTAQGGATHPKNTGQAGTGSTGHAGAARPKNTGAEGTGGTGHVGAARSAGTDAVGDGPSRAVGADTGTVGPSDAVPADPSGARDADGAGPPLLHALADTARGALALAELRPDATTSPQQARRPLCRALAAWLELGVPYEAARVRMLLAAADRAAGDQEGMVLELRAAHAAFTALGSDPEARRAAALLSRAEAHDQALPAGLSPREAQVLRLVAAGRTNREIAAELCISEHTVARHLNNMFTKLGVGSRAAATAFACTHDLA
ncbi:LuxR C-terminal-related transcriptional regulator [Streptomyces poriticola]|uniref:LuxR C-terminal-related transcriptional regulator n=1 Tax=Streptomyces poriticola TaxID=3120506 RepID=UPI002FCE52A7